MKTIATYLKALGRFRTYDLRRNAYLWFGLLWGLPVPFFSITLDLALSGSGGRTPLDALRDHSIHLLFLAHPAIFGVVFGAMGTLRHDLEEENRRLLARLTEMALTDPLTGLYNRRYFMDQLQNALHRMGRSDDPFTLVLFDLDGFKAVNDRLGHTAGDDVLRRAAGALRKAVRQGEMLCRYGGDEFLLLIPENGEVAEAVIQRAEAMVRGEAEISISAGVAHAPVDGTLPEQLIAAADLSLASRKRKHHEEQGTARR